MTATQLYFWLPTFRNRTLSPNSSDSCTDDNHVLLNTTPLSEGASGYHENRPLHRLEIPGKSLWGQMIFVSQLHISQCLNGANRSETALLLISCCPRGQIVGRKRPQVRNGEANLFQFLREHDARPAPCSIKVDDCTRKNRAIVLASTLLAERENILISEGTRIWMRLEE
jgi:hypothetical protein